MREITCRSRVCIVHKNGTDTSPTIEHNGHHYVEPPAPDNPASPNKTIEFRDVERDCPSEYSGCQVDHRNLHTGPTPFVHEVFCVGHINVETAIDTRIRRGCKYCGGSYTPRCVEPIHAGEDSRFL
jgi:hypothetical protein